jgi:glycosyltransferase involved in cell wall biosynthesis
MEPDTLWLVKLKIDRDLTTPHIIHFVEGNSKHMWLENFIRHLNLQGYKQSLLTIEPYGDLHNDLSTKFPDLKIVITKSSKAKIITALKNLAKELRSSEKAVVFAMGHRTGFVSGLATLYFPVVFVLSHTQQPNFFKFMKLNSKLRGTMHQSAYRFYTRRANLILSFSLEVRNELNKFKLNEKNILDLSFGINLEPLERQLQESMTQVYENGSNFSRILMVGRLAPEKSYTLALNAFSIFLREDPTAILTIAGIGSQKEYLENLALNLGIERNVKFLGFVENIPELMLNNDVLLHLSQTESYGQIYIEALICGLPVICTKTGVAIDLFAQGQGEFHLLEDITKENISSEFVKFFSKRRIARTHQQIAPEFLEKHSERYVYSRLSVAFESLANTK